ncbi:hypothetical protein SMC26_26545 [Actinomadura fulvescens]|uniref:Transposase n=1 Tax=Actinomadura fulvescens TaxID=46160 RepID=A0ABN3Q884_9ACTN
MFRQVEHRVSARKHMPALMSGLPRKNCWTITEHADDATPGKTQYLLERAKWAIAQVRGFARDRLDDSDAAAILDESGHRHDRSQAPIRCASRVSNAINVVYCSFATAAGHALVGARLYLPAEQATAPQRRQRAASPTKASSRPSASWVANSWPTCLPRAADSPIG